MASITLSHLQKTYGTGAKGNTVIQNLSADIHDGEFVVIVGPSGCGKSTVLNIVAGLYEATEGGVILEGREVDEPGPDRAVVFQNHALLPWLTVYQNVELAVKCVFKKSKSKPEMRDWIEHNLSLVHMDHALHKLPGELSGGSQCSFIIDITGHNAAVLGATLAQDAR